MEYEIYRIDDELYHHGIKGMRWGIRRYQTKDGGLTPAGRKRYDSDMAKVKAETRKIKNQQRTAAKLSKLDEAKQNLKNLKAAKKNAKKAEKDAEEKAKQEETDEQKKERILKAPTAKDVYENRHLFNNKEIQDLSLRIQNEENIRKNIPQQVDAGKARADKFFKNVDDATTKVVTLSKAYNTLANIVNAFGNSPVSLPKIELDNTKGNKETRRQEKKRVKEEEEAAKEKAKAAADAKKAEEQAKKDAKAAEKAAKKEAKERAKADEAARKANEAKSKEYYNSTYNRVFNRSSSTSQAGQTAASKSILALPAPTSNLPSTTVNRGKSTVSGLLNSSPKPYTGEISMRQTSDGTWVSAFEDE